LHLLAVVATNSEVIRVSHPKIDGDIDYLLGTLVKNRDPIPLSLSFSFLVESVIDEWISASFAMNLGDSANPAFTPVITLTKSGGM